MYRGGPSLLSFSFSAIIFFHQLHQLDTCTCPRHQCCSRLSLGKVHSELELRLQQVNHSAIACPDGMFYFVWVVPLRLASIKTIVQNQMSRYVCL